MNTNNIPLAERLRPSSLEDYIGQEHLVGPDGIIRRMIESGRVNSFILWGPPPASGRLHSHALWPPRPRPLSIPSLP